MENYLHENPGKNTHSPYFISYVNTPIHALSILSIHPSDIKHQEIPDEFPGTNYGEKFLPEIMAKIENLVI